mmetsp:Transcript_25181/g.35275  ORF Transcript_25181/g.35275 Transcript_25181/m.35275 type:complete len:99 (-) Transcript_25181:149-445(-)
MEPLSLSALLERALLLSRMCIFSEDIGVSTKNIYYLIFTHPLPSKGKKISCDFALQEKKLLCYPISDKIIKYMHTFSNQQKPTKRKTEATHPFATNTH